jgi:hypothetical protein
MGDCVLRYFYDQNKCSPNQNVLSATTKTNAKELTPDLLQLMLSVATM